MNVYLFTDFKARARVCVFKKESERERLKGTDRWVERRTCVAVGHTRALECFVELNIIF